jgi:hypothetical protein
MLEKFLADNWIIILAVCLVADMPLLFAVFYFQARRRVRAAESWITTLGEIVVSEVRSRKSARRGNITYSPYIVYEYEVMGQLYRGERVHLGFELGSGIESWAAEKLAAYPIGKRVEVFYDPNDPANAVLEKSAPMNKTLRLVIVGVVIGSVVAMATLLFMLTMMGTPS